MQIALIVLTALSFLSVVILLIRFGAIEGKLKEENALLRREMQSGQSELRREIGQTVQSSLASLGQTLSEAQKSSSEIQDKRLFELNAQLTERNDTLRRTLAEQLSRMEVRMEGFSQQSAKQLEAMRQDNTKQLDQMRQTVDEKLQKTLEDRLAKSFAQVSERLEQVYKGLGEMQALANGVGDLKKVLSNVKTRGILGEIQLGAILEQILSPEQYSANVHTKKGSDAVVEYAVKLPGDGKSEVWLPIDAKFPGDTYSALMDAYDNGQPEQIAVCAKELDQRIKGCAKDIHDKYIDPPNTTDFAIMFLPFEGLYAEVVRRGLVETLSRDYKVNIAGPTTMAALLNSLQMGFRTLAIQKRSGEVWSVLGQVKTEFANFNTILQKAQDRLRLANDDLDKLIGTRTRAIERRLREVEAAPIGLGEEIPAIEGDIKEDI